MLTIGIDPGISGAIALIQDSRLAEVYSVPVRSVGQTKSAKTGKVRDRKKPDLDQMVSLARQWKERSDAEPVEVFIELISPRPGRGHIGTAVLVESAALWRGVLAAVGLSVTQLSPSWWKSQYFDLKRMKKMSRTLAKKQSREMASAWFPTFQEVFAAAKNDGLAEAALIAQCGEHLRLGKISFKTKRKG